MTKSVTEHIAMAREIAANAYVRAGNPLVAKLMRDGQADHMPGFIAAFAALISPSPVGGQTDLPVAGEIARDGVEYLLDDKGFPLDVGGDDVLAIVENIPDDPTLAYTAGWNDCRKAALSAKEGQNNG